MISRNVEWPYFYSVIDGAYSADEAFSEQLYRYCFPGDALLAAEAFDHGHEFLDRRLPIAGLDCSADAAIGVVLEQLDSERVKRGLDRRYLRQHIHAVAVLLDHLRHASHLPFDPVHPLEEGRFLGLYDRRVRVMPMRVHIRA